MLFLFHLTVSLYNSPANARCSNGAGRALMVVNSDFTALLMIGDITSWRMRWFVKYYGEILF
jgi:hypothetical protein